MTTQRQASRSQSLASWMAVLLGLAALIGSGAARAQVPGTMNFQGLLLDAEGQPKNGAVTLVFGLYSVETGGSALWTETLVSVPVTDGIYDVVLGATAPLTPAVFSSAIRYLQISVDGEVLAPRRQLLVVPYAIRAEAATTAATATTAGTATTASALAANGANCSAGQTPLGVDASGAAEGCFTPQSPITQNVVYDGHAIGDAGSITMRPVSDFAGSSGDANLRMNQGDVGSLDTGIGFVLGSGRGTIDAGTGLVYNQTFGIGWGVNGTGGGAISPFAPYVSNAMESNFLPGGTAAAYDPQWEEHTTVARATSVVALTSIVGTFAANDVIVFRRPGNGEVTGIAIWQAYAAPNLTVAWVRPVTLAEPPAVNDEVETDLTSTLTNIVGAPFLAGWSLQVYPGGGSCPTYPPGAGAEPIARIHVRGWNGGASTLTFVQTFGPGSALAAGNRICNIDGNVHALLGTVGKTDTAVVASLGATTHTSDRLGPRLNVGLISLDATYGLKVSDEQTVEDYDSILAAVSGDGYPYVAINSRYPYFNSDVRFAVGDTTRTFGSLFHGTIGQYDGDSHYAVWDAGNLTGNRTYTSPDVSGTQSVFTDLTGCAEDVPIVASGAAGGVKCGTTASAQASVPAAGTAPPALDASSVSAAFVAQVYQHGDFDENGIRNSDPREGVVDLDGDEMANFIDPDNDGDGLSDAAETSRGSNPNVVTPTVARFSPPSLLAGTPGSVTVTGTNFDKLRDLQVQFGLEASQTPTNVTPTSIRVSVPAQPAGIRKVRISSSNGEPVEGRIEFRPR